MTIDPKINIYKILGEKESYVIHNVIFTVGKQGKEISFRTEC